MSAPLEPFELVVSEAEAGERIDRIVSQRPLGLSRATVQRWIEEERVRVDGAVCRASTKARAGQRVRVEPAPPSPSNAEPEDIPLSVLFEDPHLLVLDKPAGLVVHPAAGHADGTLVNALLFHAEVEDPEAEPHRPGIVHRLDKDTSGVMVVAKTAAAREGLMAKFAAHDLDREYVAIVVGMPAWSETTFDTLHGRHGTDRKRFTSRVSQGKRAVTKVRVTEALHGAALVTCRLETGRTHQIRVHLAEHHHPLLGDPLYGRTPRDARVRAAGEALGRQALHAALLGFVHPITGEALRFETPPPDDFARALAALRD